MNQQTRDFIIDHRQDDVRQLALRSVHDDVDLPLALEQIAGWQTARRKLPSWAEVDGIMWPTHLSMEQCSSEPTARYKAQLAASLVANASAAGDDTLLIDLTGGFGVDFAFMSRAFQRAVYVERQDTLCALALHNFALLGVRADVIEADGTDYLQRSAPHATLIFLDPARRDSHGARTYGIADCTPDVLALSDVLLRKADHVLLKLSPMLDWRKAVADLGSEHVAQVHIVSVGGECKELLVLMQREAPPLRLFCTNDDKVWEVPLAAGGTSLGSSSPQDFLYEPHASIMKSGCFAELSVAFGVAPLAPNSHLFTSPHLVADFPGRKFCIVAVSTMNKRELRSLLAGRQQMNITVRNFPLSVAELRKRLKLKDGGDDYLFATTLADGRHVLLLTRPVPNKK